MLKGDMLLYKYFPPARSSFLKKRLIRFTQPGMFNDPFDCLPAITGYTEKEVKEHINKVALDMAFEMGLGDFSKLDPRMTMEGLEYSSAVLSKEYSADPSAQGMRFLAALHNRMRKQIGILCLCEKHRNILMWSHYAQNHEGFVVGFESEHEFFSHRADEPEEIGQLLPITYLKKRPFIHVDIIKSEAPVPDFLFRKNEDWCYEREWRIVRFLKDADETHPSNICLFKVPPTAIKEIVFGCNAKPSMVEELREAAKEPQLAHVKFTKAALSRTDFEMDILPCDAPQPFNEALAWLVSKA